MLTLESNCCEENCEFHDAGPTNYMIENDRRIRNNGRALGERRAQTEATNVELADAFCRIENAFIGMVLSLIFAVLVMASMLGDNADIVWGAK